MIPWLWPGPVYIKRHGCNKHDHLFDEAELIKVNSDYAYVRYADDCETIVYIRGLFAPHQKNFEEN